MMYTWGWRSGALVLLCGTALWGVYQTGLQSIEQSLASLLDTDASIGAMRLDSSGRIHSLSDIEIVGGDLAACTLASVRLHSAPWSIMTNQPHLEKVVGNAMELAPSDRWSRELESVIETIGTIDPELQNLNRLEAVDIAAETDAAMIPLLASWRGEWQSVLASYQKQISTLDSELLAVEQTQVDTSNPLRDRSLIKSQMSSIERLTEQFALIESDLQVSKAKLLDRAAALQTEGQTVVDQRIAEKEKEVRARLKERTAKNLEALRGQLFAKLIGELKDSQHIVSNLAHRGTRVLDGKYSVPASRGQDMLEQFGSSPSLKVHCLEFNGSCQQDSSVGFVSGFYPNHASETSGGKFFVACRAAQGSAANRFTGSMKSADQYQFNGTIRMKPESLSTGLLTEPNFELSYDGAELDIQTVVTPKGRQLEVQWRAKNACLKTVVSDEAQAFNLSRSPLDHKDCLATLNVSLDGDDRTSSTVDEHDNFFGSWNLKIVEGCSEADVIKKDVLASDASAIKRMIDQECRVATDAMGAQTTKIASARNTMDVRYQRFASEITPRQIRTASGGNTLQR